MCRRLKDEECLRQIPVIFLTALKEVMKLWDRTLPESIRIESMHDSEILVESAPGTRHNVLDLPSRSAGESDPRGRDP